MTTLLRGLRRIRHGLTTLDHQPISRIALVVVLLLDLFILVSIFEGLEDHTRQLVTPEEYIPRHCRDVVIDREWNESNRLVKTAELAAAYRLRYLHHVDRAGSVDLHPICEPITARLRAIEKDRQLSAQLSDFLQLRAGTEGVRAELERARGAYDTLLLKRIAGDSSSEAAGTALQAKVQETSARLDALLQDEDRTARGLGENPRLIALFSTIASVSAAERERLIEDLRHRHFWQPIQRLGMEMLFLLPLLAVFYFWNAKSLAGNRPLQTLVSSHLLVVAFIPVLFKLAELVFDIIPRDFLRQLMEVLVSLKLVAIWHYLLMGLAVVAALALIHTLQKKLFAPQRLADKRISRGQCQQCGAGMPADSAACPLCGFKQFRQCQHCDRSTFVLGRYCRSCGEPGAGVMD